MKLLRTSVSARSRTDLMTPPGSDTKLVGADGVVRMTRGGVATTATARSRCDCSTEPGSSTINVSGAVSM